MHSEKSANPTSANSPNAHNEAGPTMHENRTSKELTSRFDGIHNRQTTPYQKLMVKGEDFFPHDVSIFVRQRAADMPRIRFLSNHHYFILLLACSGTGQYELGEETYSIEPGTALLTFPFQVHCHKEASDELSWLFIRFEAETDGLINPLRHSPRQLTDQVMSQALRLVQIFQDSDAQPSPTLSLQSSLSVVALMQSVLAAPVKTGVRKASEDNDEMKLMIKDFVEQNMSDSIQIVDVADDLGLSPSYLRALFSKYYGISLGHFILKLKVTYACQFLRNSTMQMQEIANATGFNSGFSFSRAFKRMMQLTPREYRDWFNNR